MVAFRPARLGHRMVGPAMVLLGILLWCPMWCLAGDPTSAPTTAPVPDVHERLGKLFLQAQNAATHGDNDQAFKLFYETANLASTLPATDPQRLFEPLACGVEGAILIQRGQPQLAMERCDHGLKVLDDLPPNSPLLHFLRGTCLAVQAEAENALHHGPEGFRIAGQAAKELDSFEAAVPAQIKACAAIRSQLGQTYKDLGHPAEAIAEFDKAIALNRQLKGADVDIARLVSKKGLTYSDLKNFANASKSQREALDILKPIEHTDEDQAECLNRLGLSKQNAGKLDEAGKALAESADLYGHLQNKRRQGEVLSSLAALLRSQHQYDQSVDTFKRSISLLGNDPDEAASRAECLYNYGQCLKDKGDFNHSVQAFKDSATQYESAHMYGEQRDCFNRIGEIETNLDKYKPAADAFEMAISISQAHPAETSGTGRGTSFQGAGTALRNLGHAELALSKHKSALAIFSSLESNDDNRSGLADSQRQIGHDLAIFQRNRVAWDAFTTARNLYLKCKGSDKFQALCLKSMADAEAQDTTMAAEVLLAYRDASRIYESLPNDNTDIGLCCQQMAMHLEFHLDDAVAAEDEWRKAADALAGVKGMEVLELNCLGSLGDCQFSLKRPQDAISQYRKAVEFATKCGQPLRHARSWRR